MKSSPGTPSGPHALWFFVIAIARHTSLGPGSDEASAGDGQLKRRPAEASAYTPAGDRPRRVQRTVQDLRIAGCPCPKSRGQQVGTALFAATSTPLTKRCDLTMQLPGLHRKISLAWLAPDNPEGPGEFLLQIPDKECSMRVWRAVPGDLGSSRKYGKQLRPIGGVC